MIPSWVALVLAMPLFQAEVGEGILHDLYREVRWIDTDPYHSATSLGYLYRPSGCVKRVTWYQDSGLGNDPDHPGWEKRLVQEWLPNGQATKIEYWEAGKLVSMIEAERDRGRLIRLATSDGSGKVQRQHSFDYSSGRLVRVTDAVAGSSPVTLVEYEYSNDGLLREVKRWQGKRAEFFRVEYDQNGVVATVQQSAEDVTGEYVYDREGRLVSSRLTSGGASFAIEHIYEKGMHLERRSRDDVLRRIDVRLYGSPERKLVLYETFVYEDDSAEAQVYPLIAGVDIPLGWKTRDGRYYGINHEPIRRQSWEEMSLTNEVTVLYFCDDRGNWVSRQESSTLGHVLAVMRIIEYCD